MGDAFERFKGSRHWSPDRPKDPDCAHLDILNIEVVAANDTIMADPNNMLALALKDGLRNLKPLPGRTSVISGEPAVLYRTNEAAVALTVEELERLVLRDLTPDEFFAICDAVGAIWELHDDFYDPETGEALQPKRPAPPLSLVK